MGALREPLYHFLLMVMNIFCVVGLVGVLKLLFSLGFHYSSILVTSHFFFCGVAAKMYTFCKPSAVVTQVSREHIMTIAVLKVASVSFHNLSLLFNSMTLFEVLSFLTIPVICSVEYLCQGKVYSLSTYTALAIIILGSAVSTVTEVDFSWVGLLNGLLCTLSTALYQLYNSQLQTAHQVDALQLLTFEAPFTSAAALATAFAFGEPKGVLAYQFNLQVMLLIIGSIFLAIGVNVSAYLILGKTSAVTYQVVGHMKTFCVLCLGYIVFQSPFTIANALGTAVAVVGVVSYSHVKLSGAVSAALNNRGEEALGEGAASMQGQVEELLDICRKPGNLKDRG